MTKAPPFVLAGAIALAGCGGPSVEDPLAFTPTDSVEPRCELKPGAGPDAVAARDALLANWTTTRADRATKKQALDGLASALGLPGADDSLVLEAMETETRQLAKRGCTLACKDRCTAVHVACKDDADAQRRANAFTKTIDAYLPELMRSPPISPRGRSVPNADLDRCDQLFGLSYGEWFSAAFMDHVLGASREEEMQRCPLSKSACVADCGKGDLNACVTASVIDPSMPDDTKLDYRLKACASPALDVAANGCSAALQLANDKPAVQARIGSALDRFCGGTPTIGCAELLAFGGDKDWVRRRAVVSNLLRSLGGSCEAMGADACGTLVSGLAAHERSLLDAAIQAKVAATLRKSCDGGHGLACLGLVSMSLSDVTTRAERATFLSRACDLDVDRCPTAAYCFSGKCAAEVAPDPAREQRANTRICADQRAKRGPDVAIPQCQGVKP